MRSVINQLIIPGIFILLFPVCNREDIWDIERISSLSVIPSSYTVSPNVNVQYSAILTYDDNSTFDVTDSVTWNVSGSASSGTSPGSVIAYPTAGTAVISCEYLSVSSADTGDDASLIVTQDIFVALPADGGSDSNLGTSVSPYATMEYALSMASVGTNIRIAKGDYYPVSQLQLATDGVSLYGGYASDWSYDIIANRARIFDISTTGADPKGAIACTNAITAATVIDGLEIYGSTAFTGNDAAAIYTEGSPVLNNCLLDGGGGANSNSSYGIYSVSTTDLTVNNCDINGGNGPNNSYGIYFSDQNGNLLITNSNIFAGISTTYSYGVYSYAIGNSIIDRSVINGGTSNITYGFFQPSIASSSLIIQNSMISGGEGTSNSLAIFFQNNNEPSPLVYNNIIVGNTNPAGGSTVKCIRLGQASSPVIANNTIISGNAVTTAYGIELAYGARPYIYNNIIDVPSGTARYGIYEAYSGADPSEVRNNSIYNTTVLYRDYDTTTDWITVPTMESGLGGELIPATGNLEADPMFIGATDYHLQMGSPAFGNGLNGIDEGWSNFPLDSGGIPIDYDGNLRAQGGGGAWTIGAYE